MIHISAARKIIESKEPFSCRCWNKNGEILSYNDVVCTSSFFANNTVNVKFITSGEIRKMRIITLFEINDEEIYL